MAGWGGLLGRDQGNACTLIVSNIVNNIRTLVQRKGLYESRYVSQITLVALVVFATNAVTTFALEFPAAAHLLDHQIEADFLRECCLPSGLKCRGHRQRIGARGRARRVSASAAHAAR